MCERIRSTDSTPHGRILERVRSPETSDSDDYIHNRLLLQRKRDGDNCTPACAILGPNKPTLGLDDAFADG